MERGDAWLEFPAPRGALHTGLTFGRRGSSPAPRAGLLVLVFPLPHKYLCAQGSNIKWQIKIIMTGQERNPGRNEKALYLIPLIAPFPCFFNERLCIFILHLTLRSCSQSRCISLASHKRLRKSLFRVTVPSPMLGVLLLERLGTRDVRVAS